jgi:acetylornithine deacetylase
MHIERGDAVGLARELVRIDSRNPSLVNGAPGEGAVARALADILTSWGFRAELIEAAPGRPNVVAWIAGGETSTATLSPAPSKAGPWPSNPALLFNGHLDVVGVDGMVHPPFDAETRGGRMYGRGATDMKGGVAAMCAAATRAADAGVTEGIVITAVADEEFQSIGTSDLVRRGLRARAAIVTEPTRLTIAPAHKGFAWVEVVVGGKAAHGSRYDIGVDAIRHAGLLLAELDTFEERELSQRTHSLLGHASLHASLVSGGTGMSTYPDRCVLHLERRTIPGEKAADAVAEVEAACARVHARRATFEATVIPQFAQSPSDVALDAPIVRALSAAVRDAGLPATFEGLSAWTDAALLNDAGIPAICFGPGDIALAHAAEEYVVEMEIERATDVLTRLAGQWCRTGEGAWRS